MSIVADVILNRLLTQGNFIKFYRQMGGFMLLESQKHVVGMLLLSEFVKRGSSSYHMSFGVS